MNCKRLMISVMALTALVALPSQATVKPYFNFGLTFGGDDLISFVTTGGTDTIKAGELAYMTAGAVIPFENSSLEMQVGGGYAFSNKTYTNGDASFNRIPIELLLMTQQDKMRFGGGIAYHIDPSLSCDIPAIGCTGDVSFDNSLGYILEGDWIFSDINNSRMMLGLRYTSIEYETVDGSNIGIFFMGDF